MLERFSKAARSAVMQARESALRSPDGRITCENLLVGLAEVGEPHLAEAGLTAASLQAAIDASPGGPDTDAASLSAIGIDLDGIRSRVDDTFGRDAWHDAGPRPRRRLTGRLFGKGHRLTPAARKVLELGLREALVEESREITTTHLLRGILRAPGDGVLQLLTPQLLATLRTQTRRAA